MMRSLLLLAMLLSMHSCVYSFQLGLPPTKTQNLLSRDETLARHPISSLKSASEEDSWGEDEDVENNEDDFEILFEDQEPPLDAIEKAWRYAKKPLLSIGAKGASFSHGNSLRQLLDSHTVVKVKVNTNKFGKEIIASSCVVFFRGAIMYT